MDFGAYKGKILIAYFSRTGENYGVGNISKGNTEIVAELIQQNVGGELFHIEPAAAYPNTYDECVALAKKKKMPIPVLSLQKLLKVSKSMMLFSWASQTGGAICPCLYIPLLNSLILQEKLLFLFVPMRAAA